MARGKSDNAFWGLIFMGLVFGGVGGGLFYWNTTQAIRAKASATWPTTPGKITQSRIVSHSDDDGTTWGPEIVYEYYVDGDTLAGNTITIVGATFSSNPNNGRDLIREYPVGMDVEIYVDPADGYKSVLIPGYGPSRGTLWFLWIFGGVFFLAGAGMFVGGIYMGIKGI